MTQKTAFVLMIFSLIVAGFIFWMFLYFLNNREEMTLSIPKESSLTLLSDAFLDQAVFKRKKALTECIHSHIKGTIHLEMIVFPSGSNKINLVQSTLNRPGAVKCIFSILEKIKFPSFKGPKIIRFYTLHFNQTQNS